jgi:hypothetical protein
MTFYRGLDASRWHVQFFSLDYMPGAPSLRFVQGWVLL